MEKCNLHAIFQAQPEVKADFLKLTLPTVPMALTYVQLFATGLLSQYFF